MTTQYIIWYNYILSIYKMYWTFCSVHNDFIESIKKLQQKQKNKLTEFWFSQNWKLHRDYIRTSQTWSQIRRHTTLNDFLHLRAHRFIFWEHAQMYGIIILFKSIWENGLFWKFKFFVSVSVVSCFHDSKIIYIIIAVPSAKFNLSKYRKTYFSSHLILLLLEYCFL